MTKARSNATAKAAKGDLTVGSGTNLSDVLAVGNNGETIVADSSTATGLRYQGNYAAGKNKIINGDFGIWQRGTSFTPTSGSFSADRFYNVFDGTGSTRNISRQTFTPGTAPVAGYEGTYFLRYATSVAGTGGNYSTVSQNIEDVRTFAGQTVTFSFWAKAASNITLPAVYAVQRFGSGGSTEVATSIATNVAVTTSWQRFTYTFTVPSISGKTIGTGSYLDMEFYTPLNSTYTLDTWGWQLEAGSVATSFQTATGTIQGELAACQRYYERRTAQGSFFGMGLAGRWSSTTSGTVTTTFASPKRVNPSVAMSSLSAASAGSNLSVTSVAGVYGSGQANGVIAADITINVASGATSGYATTVFDSGSANGYIEFSAEL